MLSIPRLVLAICAVAVLALAALGGIAGARGSDSVKVKVGDDFFSPDSKTVKAGTKVKFKWIGSDKHDVFKKSGPGSGFDSGPLEGSGVLYSHKFKKQGTYRIICTIHDDMKLKLKVN